MAMIRSLFARAARRGTTRFDRYYGGVIRSGAGYPTADEARRDRRNAAGNPFDIAR